MRALKPILENLLADKEQDKQRAAAELLAGVLNGRSCPVFWVETGFLFYRLGSKHWPTEAQGRLWEWFTPLIKETLSRDIKTDTLSIWTTFLEVRCHCACFVRV